MRLCVLGTQVNFWLGLEFLWHVRRTLTTRYIQKMSYLAVACEACGGGFWVQNLHKFVGIMMRGRQIGIMVGVAIVSVTTIYKGGYSIREHS
jgi:hypothetical protein